MTPFILLIATYLPPAPGVVRDRCDVIEQNIVYTETSEDEPLTHKPIFTQYLFREWNEATGNHEIIAWRMLKSDPAEEIDCQVIRRRTLMAPRLNQLTGYWEMRWMDGDVERLVEAKTFVVTMTLGDGEVEERELFPLEKRRNLRK